MTRNVEFSWTIGRNLVPCPETTKSHASGKLEGSPARSLRELVDNVPDDYPKNTRTVRRDLEALEAVGFPLVTERRNGQTRWRLMEGFRDIPALGFSATELMALLLSRNLLKPLEGTEIAESLKSALGKASTALPPQGHEYLRAMEQMFSVGLGPHKSCRSYQMPLDFKVDEYHRDAIGVMRSGRRIEVELLFSRKAAAWVKDKTWRPSQETKLVKDGRLKMTLKCSPHTRG